MVSANITPIIIMLLASLDMGRAHNWLQAPPARSGLFSGASICEKSGAGQITTVARGANLDTRWSYNNHRGGFVRFSIAKRADVAAAGNTDIFKNTENIVYMGCHNANCGGASGSDYKAGDGRVNAPSVPSQGDADLPNLSCTRSITIPTWLDDGDYTLQWAVYSMYDSYGEPGRGLAKFHNCADLKISGGSAKTAKPATCAFTWKGGDRIIGLSQDSCSYFNSNSYQTYQNPDDDKLNDASLVKVGRPAEVDSCNGKTNPGAVVAAQADTSTTANTGDDDDDDDNDDDNDATPVSSSAGPPAAVGSSAGPPAGHSNGQGRTWTRTGSRTGSGYRTKYHSQNNQNFVTRTVYA